MSFLPENYEQPASGGKYTKLESGTTRIRIISNSIVGWLGWTKDNKPVRDKSKDIIKGIDNLRDQPRHFWAFLVWNYNTAQIEVMEITQRTIQNAIMELYKSSDWGDPKSYDITINKKGEGMSTEYHIQGAPKSQFEPQIVKKAFEDGPVNLQAILTGDDPFDVPANEKEMLIEKFLGDLDDLPF